MLFKTVPIADSVFRLERLPAGLVGSARESLTLGWEQRARTRARRRTDQGTEFATSLPRGTVLREGDCLPLENPPLLIIVHELAEPVLVARPASFAQWAEWAYHVGNNHQPLMIAHDGLVCPDDPGVSQVLDHHRIPFTRETRPFVPVSQSPGHDTAWQS